MNYLRYSVFISLMLTSVVCKWFQVF